MKLIIQTSSAAFGMGLLSSTGVLLHEIHGRDRLPLARNLGDLFRALTADARVGPADIDGVCVDLGPGGLSSTRAGVSFANAFAYATPARLAGVSALDLLMLAARSKTERPVIALRPAQGGQAFWAFYVTGDLRDWGCEPPGPVIARTQQAHGDIALAGPLARLRLEAGDMSAVQLLDIDPPPLAHFATARWRRPAEVAGVAILEPITAPDALGPA